MKIFVAIFKWFFWCIGFPLVFGAIVLAVFDDTSDRWISVFSLLFFGLIMISVGYALKFNKYKSNTELQPEKSTLKNELKFDKSLADIASNAEVKWKEEAKKYRYHKDQINGKVFQALESMEIIESTKNLDTLQSRYTFLQNLFHELQLASTNNRYLRDAQDTIGEYKQLYYDKIPRITQLAGIIKPLEFDMITFGGNSVFNCFLRHYNFQKQQIEVLKTETGKKGRYKKLLESVDESLIALRDDFIGCTDFENLYQKLKEIKKEIEQKAL